MTVNSPTIKPRPGLKQFVPILGLLLLSTSISVEPSYGSFLKTDSPEFKEWQKVQKKGAEAFTVSEYGKAERTLKVAVEKARKIGPGDIRLAKSAGDLGRLLTVRGRFSEAEPYLEEELAYKDIAVKGSTDKLIEDMGDLTKFYLNYGTKSKAVPLTEEILDFVEGKIREQRNQKSRMVTLEKGAPLQGWAGTAKPELVTPIIEWAVTCDSLGYLYRVKKNYDLADQLYKAALDIKATVLGKKHLSLANSYDSIATVCMARKDYKEAESYYREALQITERILLPGDPKIYWRMDKLAKCLMREKKYGEAEKLYLRANKIYGGSKSLYKQRALFALGCLYSNQRRFSSAAPLLRRALRLAEKNHGVHSVALVPYLRKYAYVSYYLGNRGATGSLRARANNIAPVVKALKPTVKMMKLEKKTTKTKVN